MTESEFSMFFGQKILDYKEDILKDLDELIKIQSVSSQGSEMPAKALEWILQKAENMGFSTKNINGIAGHVEYGDGEELAAVLAHVDVVPAGDGWSVEPFALTEKNGRLYGRGVVDDKGPAIVALYCLKALKDNGIVPKRKIRLIFGAAEEIGMNDMEEYFKHEKMPDMAFTPDSEYGICKCEKGILQLEISSEINENSYLKEFHSGNAVNAVPSRADAFVDREFQAVGKASHGSTPELGVNAAVNLIKTLSDIYGYSSLGNLCTFLGKEIGSETDGKSLGISCQDELSGNLTVNLGVVDIDKNISHAFIDIRYPVTEDFAMIIKQVGAKAAPYSLKVGVYNHEEPLCIDENSPVMTILKNAYQTVTGEEPEIYSTGGGTYARTLKNNGAAFGPVFKGDISNIHDVDESIDKNNFFQHAQICLQAIFGFAGK